MGRSTGVPINPEILRWAIDDIGISIEEAAKRITVKPEQFQNWIKGNTFPTYKQLEKLSYKVLKLPLATFFLSDPPINQSIKKKFRSLPDYLIYSTSYKTRIAIRKADFYKTALYDLYKKNPSESPIFRSIKLLQEKNPDEEAANLRDLLGINFDIQKNFRTSYEAFNKYRLIFEQAGIFTFQLRLEGDRGFCLFDSEFPIIIINSSDAINSKIFTLFHEFIHILKDTDDILKEQVLPSYNMDAGEVFCNKVSSEILAPKIEIRNRYSDSLSYWDNNLIKKIAASFKVSREVILLKLIELGYAKESDYAELKPIWDREFKEREKSKGGDYYINKVSALGKRYVFTVLDNYKMGFINDLQVSSYLDMKFTNLPKIESEVYAH